MGIPFCTVLMKIPMKLMVWDLAATRDKFTEKELFRGPLFDAETSDAVSKRATLLYVYLTLLQNGIASLSWTLTLQSSVARALSFY